MAPATPEGAAARRAPVQSKKTLVGLPAASFFGQLPSTPGPAQSLNAARPEALAPQPRARERDATEEVSLSDMSLSSFGASAGNEATQDVSLHELSLASRRAESDVSTSPQERTARTNTLSTLPAPAARSRRWLWAVAAVPLLVGAGWLALDKSKASEAGKGVRSVAVVAPASSPAAAAVSTARAVDDVPPAGAEPSAAAQALPEQGDKAARKRADALISQASALRKRKKLGPARSKYQAALTLVPGDPGALRGLVQVALQQRDGNQAVQRARELVDTNPDELSYLVLLGDAYKAAGKPKDARETWQTAARRGSTLARKRLK